MTDSEEHVNFQIIVIRGHMTACPPPSFGKTIKMAFCASTRAARRIPAVLIASSIPKILSCRRSNVISHDLSTGPLGINFPSSRRESPADEPPFTVLLTCFKRLGVFCNAAIVDFRSSRSRGLAMS